MTPLDAVLSDDALSLWGIPALPTGSNRMNVLPHWDRNVGRDASSTCSSPVCPLPLQRASASRERRKHPFLDPLQWLRARWSRLTQSHWALAGECQGQVPHREPRARCDTGAGREVSSFLSSHGQARGGKTGDSEQYLPVAETRKLHSIRNRHFSKPPLTLAQKGRKLSYKMSNSGTNRVWGEEKVQIFF